jgi:exo-beta-1,3-glucanase (GH17 family)
MSSRKFGLNLVVVLAIAALFTGFWALINRPVTAPNWPEQISGFSYSPFQQGQFPQKDQYPTDDQMRQDLAIMSKLTDNIRTYSVDGTLGDIPKLAEEFGLRVTLGIWISPDLARNEREIQRAIEIANSSRSVVRVVVGNEALFREEITPEALIVLLDRVRAAGAGQARRPDRRAHPAVLGIYPDGQGWPVRTRPCPGPEETVPEKAAAAVGGWLAE